MKSALLVLTIAAAAEGYCIGSAGSDQCSSSYSLKTKYDQDGFVFPLEAVPAQEALDLGAELMRLSSDERLRDHSVPKHQKVNLLYPAVDALVRDTRITDLVAEALGEENLISMATDLFIKLPNTTGFISWHQDSYYQVRLQDDVPMLTAVLALSNHTMSNGCLKYSRGGHTRGKLTHYSSDDPSNILTQKQTIPEAELNDEIVQVELEPGQLSMHAWHMPHMSGPNDTPDARIGLAIRYMPTWIKCIADPCDPPFTVRLARGEDPHRNFQHDPIADEPLSEHSLRIHEQMLLPHAKNKFSTT